MIIEVLLVVLIGQTLVRDDDEHELNDEMLVRIHLILLHENDEIEQCSILLDKKYIIEHDDEGMLVILGVVIIMLDEHEVNDDEGIEAVHDVDVLFHDVHEVDGEHDDEVLMFDMHE